MKSCGRSVVFGLVVVTAACSGNGDTGRATESGNSVPTTVVRAESDHHGGDRFGIVGSLPFDLVRCDPDPYVRLAADPSFYRDTPVYEGNGQPIEAVRAWAATQPGFQEIWIDRAHNGWIAVGFSEDAASRKRDLESEFPGVGVVAVDVDRTQAELDALRDEIGVAMADTPLGFGAFASASVGYVILEVGVLDADTLAPLARFAGRPFCVMGIDPADAVPDLPQPTEGDGWRLLGTDRTGLSYRTGVATTDEQYSTVWRRSGLGGDPPTVDFTDEIVIWFGSVYGGGCEHRLDDVVVDVDRRLIHGRFAVHGPPPVCLADDNPKAYVVALERRRLPGAPFTVQLGASDPPGGAPEERTVVTVDLREPGSTATDDQLTFDLDLVDEPRLVDAVGRGATVDPDIPFTYTLRTDCTLQIVGPINGIVWSAERDVGAPEGDVDDLDAWRRNVPDAWAESLETRYDRVIVVGVINPDETLLTFTAEGHTERFVPAPQGTYSDCH